MRVKSATQRNITPYKVGGLIFPSQDRYVDLKGIDSDVDIILSDLDNDPGEILAFLDKIKPIEVIETYPGARKEMDGLFPNLTRLDRLEGDKIIFLNIVFAFLFFKKFNDREQ